MSKNKKISIKTIFILATLLRIILVLISKSHPDIYNHIDWGKKYFSIGPKKFYENTFWAVSWPNQPPASIYLFALIERLRQVIFSAFSYVNQTIPLFPSKLIFYLEKNLHIILLKTPLLIADLLIGLLIYKFGRKKTPNKAKTITALWLFNPATIYNSAIWGQTDPIINLLALLSIKKLIENKHGQAIIFFSLSIFFKLSLLIYLPIFLIFLVKKLNKNKLKNIFIGTVISILIFYLHNIPFKSVPEKNIIDWAIYLYKTKVFQRQGDMLNGNAFNFWLISYGLDLSNTGNILLAGIKLKTYGYIISLFLMAIICLKFYFQKTKTNLYFLYSLFLTAFTTFLFLTNMHERYLYPIFPLIALIMLIQPKLINIKQYLLLSAIHLVNLYNLWFYPSVSILKNILVFNDFIIAKTLSIILIVIYATHLTKFLKNSEIK